MKKHDPITPGEILLEEFLKPMGLSQYRLAKGIGVPAQRISEIISGKRGITADTDLRLCRFFGLSNGYWLRAQAAYDTEVAEHAIGPLLKNIKPWPDHAAQQQGKNQPGTGPHRVVLPEWISCAPFERLLEMDIVAAKDGRAELTMPFRYEFAQGAGLMHGGAIVSLADTAVVMAIKSLVPKNTHFATIRLESEFLYPVRRGMVTAKAAARREGDRTIEGKATVFDDAGRAVLSFRSTFKIARESKIRGHSE